MNECIWKHVVARAQESGLDKKLPQSDPKFAATAISASWQNVAPRTQKIVNLMVNNASVQISGSSLNVDVVELLHGLIAKELETDQELVVGSLRHWITGHHNFAVKPNIHVKRKGLAAREESLYRALRVVIDVLQPYI